ncbi:hypothetical protein F5887DRAFT_895956 [Amanita rubescens]|nr:hypothetical protein F5887DRAFT_895956 [Amanita rubescens]
MVIRDVRTRWNFTHAMIRRALLLREAINSWVFAVPELHGLILKPSDWSILEQIADILEVCTN